MERAVAMADRRTAWLGLALGFVALLLMALPVRATEVSAKPAAIPRFETWTTFTVRDGLPSDKVFALAVEPERLWVGTEQGLARLEDGRWSRYGTAEGLVYPVVTDVAVEPETGNLWIGTFGGLSRLSGERFESFTQLDSGLVNDVIYAVAAQGHRIWAATAAGTSAFDTWKGEWEIFTNRNAPMHEIWCYGLSVGEGKVSLAVWGGGVLQYDLVNERWREYRDPDHEMEIDLLPDDGPVSDVVASVAHAEGILWAGTYFGANRYDGRRWQSYSKEDSGLASNFINRVVAEGRSAWFGTDDGLSHFDGEVWTTYKTQPEGETGGLIITRDGESEQTVTTKTSIAHNFVLAVARRDGEIWVGTEKGLSLGLPERRSENTKFNHDLQGGKR
jgi:ligand-binding sensor domain-containing protein